MLRNGLINNFVGCPGGNYAMEGNPFSIAIALISTFCLIIITYKLFDCEKKGIWFFIGVITVFVVTGINLITYNGW